MLRSFMAECFDQCRRGNALRQSISKMVEQFVGDLDSFDPGQSSFSGDSLHQQGQFFGKPRRGDDRVHIKASGEATASQIPQRRGPETPRKIRPRVRFGILRHGVAPWLQTSSIFDRNPTASADRSSVQVPARYGAVRRPETTPSDCMASVTACHCFRSDANLVSPWPVSV